MPIADSSQSVPALYYQPSCYNCFHFTIIFKFVAAKVLLHRCKQAINRSVMNSLDIITTIVGLAVTKLYVMYSLSYLSTFLSFFLLKQQPPVGQGLLIHEVSRSHTTMPRSRYDSSGRVISTSQRSLPDNTQQTSMAPVGFEPTVSAGERPQTYALDRAATGIGILSYQDSLLKNKRICKTFMVTT